MCGQANGTASQYTPWITENGSVCMEAHTYICMAQLLSQLHECPDWLALHILQQKLTQVAHVNAARRHQHVGIKPASGFLLTQILQQQC